MVNARGSDVSRAAVESVNTTSPSNGANTGRMARARPALAICETRLASAGVSAALVATQAMVALPQYEAFTQLVPRLTQQGLRFVEIVDSDEIMLTALAPAAWVYNAPNSELLFSLALPTDQSTRRLVINVPVEHLHSVLAKLAAEGVARDVHDVFGSDVNRPAVWAHIEPID